MTLCLYLVPFSRYLTSNILWFDFDFWPLKVIQGQKIIPFESPCMTSYLTSIDTFPLSCTVFEIYDFKRVRVWPWPLTSKDHPRSFLFNFHWHFVSILYRFRDIWFQTFQGLTLTFDLKRSSKVKKNYTIRKPIHDFLSNFHWHFSLSRTVFEIFDFKHFRVWLWLLTSKGHPKSKNYTIRKPIHDFLSNFYWHFLSLVRFMWYLTSNLLEFDLDLWSKSRPRSKNAIPFESPYVTSYLSPIDTFSLSCTVFEIFYFKLFGVWPWTLTS